MDNPNFYLEGVVRDKDRLSDFEGPLSLILMLLSKNKIEIRDIKIADILEQYLDYLSRMQSMDLEIASEFVQMAAHLLYIKTRTLLSGEEEVSELEVLMASLEQLRAKDAAAAIQKVIPQLKDAAEYGLSFYAKQPEPAPRALNEYSYRHEPADLLKALLAIFSRGGKAPESEFVAEALPQRIIYSVKDKSREILLRIREGGATLAQLYANCRTRSEIVATFISVLELCSMGSVALSHGDGGYALSFVGGDVEEIIGSIVE